MKKKYKYIKGLLSLATVLMLFQSCEKFLEEAPSKTTSLVVGINAPEAVLSDAVNSGVIDAAGSFGISGFDLPSQLAGAGIDAARSLLTKRLKRIKQPLKSGYQVLLRDNTRKK